LFSLQDELTKLLGFLDLLALSVSFLLLGLLDGLLSLTLFSLLLRIQLLFLLLTKNLLEK
jgi:hypothetical protein